jgi:hypothetical protein
MRLTWSKIKSYDEFVVQINASIEDSRLSPLFYIGNCLVAINAYYLATEREIARCEVKYKHNQKTYEFVTAPLSPAKLDSVKMISFLGCCWR